MTISLIHKQRGHLALEHLLLTAGALLLMSGLFVALNFLNNYSTNFQEQGVIINN